jgi:hypothetical protein
MCQREVLVFSSIFLAFFRKYICNFSIHCSSYVIIDNANNMFTHNLVTKTDSYR